MRSLTLTFAKKRIQKQICYGKWQTHKIDSIKTKER